MPILVSLVGVLIVAGSLTLTVAPQVIFGIVTGMDPSTLYWVGVLSRGTIGVVFLMAAAQCRMPRFVQVVGGLTLAAALVILLVGPDSIQAMIQWFLEMPSAVFRVIGAISLAFGALVVYAGVGRQPTDD